MLAEPFSKSFIKIFVSWMSCSDHVNDHYKNEKTDCSKVMTICSQRILLRVNTLGGVSLKYDFGLFLLKHDATNQLIIPIVKMNSSSITAIFCLFLEFPRLHICVWTCSHTFFYEQLHKAHQPHDGEVVTQSTIVTSKRYSMISKMVYDVYAINNDLDTIEEVYSLRFHE